MEMPSVYRQGYERAHALDPLRADNYIAHTMIGDPLADGLMEELAPLGQRETGRLIQRAMDAESARELGDVPDVLREFFADSERIPAWLDLSALGPGVRMFHRNSNLVVGAMAGGTLVEGFATNIAKSFFVTGRLRDQGARRLKQNNRHMVEIFMPGGLERVGDGWKLSVRIRLIHAQIRRLLNGSEDWLTEELGTPISAAHLGLAITAFSARALKHLKSLGGNYNDEERAAFMQVWRYTGHLMGIPESILYRDEAEALEIFKIGGLCEPPIDPESVVLAHSLVNSAPVIAGITDPEERRKLASYVFRVSRALIGAPLANELRYPRFPTFGVLWWFRMQNRYNALLSKILRSRARDNNKMASLFNVSMFDEKGLTYHLPDHVYAEQSSRW